MRYQKPGLTAMKNERIFVVHNYHDHAEEPQDHSARETQFAPFPVKLHSVLDQVERDGADDVISWQPHGRSFLIHKPKEFVATIMPKYFKQTKLTSFQRQLCLYGFQRLTTGLDCGAYYNEYFLRGKPWMAKLHMRRVRVKGTRYKAASNPENEPNLYTFPFVTTTTPAFAASLMTPAAPPAISSAAAAIVAASSQSPSFTVYVSEKVPQNPLLEEEEDTKAPATITMNRSEMMSSESECMEIDMDFLTADPMSDFFAAATPSHHARTESEVISLSSGSDCSLGGGDGEYVALEMEKVTEFRQGYPVKALARAESEVVSIGESDSEAESAGRFLSMDNFDFYDPSSDDDPEFSALLQDLMADSVV